MKPLLIYKILLMVILPFSLLSQDSIQVSMQPHQKMFALSDLTATQTVIEKFFNKEVKPEDYSLMIKELDGLGLIMHEDQFMKRYSVEAINIIGYFFSEKLDKITNDAYRYMPVHQLPSSWVDWVFYNGFDASIKIMLTHNLLGKEGFKMNIYKVNEQKLTLESLKKKK